MDYEHIVGATDFSELGNIALRRACELAVAANAKLTLLHVLPEPDSPSPLVAHYEITTSESRREGAIEAAREALRALVPETVVAAGVECVIEVQLGDPAHELLALDLRVRPDLIVMATHGRRGWEHWIMGSVAERVVRMATADVLAVRERPGEA